MKAPTIGALIQGFTVCGRRFQNFFPTRQMESVAFLTHELCIRQLSNLLYLTLRIVLVLPTLASITENTHRNLKNEISTKLVTSKKQ